jgi:uncharacterized repeat protein (TIGR01451 family)
VKRRGWLVACLALAGLVAFSAAAATTRTSPVDTVVCKKGGWKSHYTRAGRSFRRQGACVDYLENGGKPIVKAALDCLNDGWQALGRTPSEPFRSERACVDFADGGGTPVQVGADLALTKSVDHSSPNVGDTVTFTVKVTDLGPAEATGVRVKDALPAGLTFVSATPSHGTYDSATGLWMVGTVTTAASRTLAIAAKVVSPAPGANTATIAHADQLDPRKPNNTASVVLEVPSADLAIGKTVSNPVASQGDTVTFTVTLTDRGPAAATGVTVQDLLPAGFTFLSATPSQGTYSPATGVWAVGTVTTATPQTLLIPALVASQSPGVNTASISHADQFDPAVANNSASATVQVTPPPAPQPTADLGLTQLLSSAAPNVGDTVTFTVTLTNVGPDTATNVSIQDLLPAGLTFVSATPSQGTYNAVTGLWSVGTVTTSPVRTLALVAAVVSGSAQTNTASISHADQNDPTTANNSTSVTETPQPADLHLVKTVSNATPNVGDTVTFTVTLTDGGPSTATNVTVQDQLPAGLTFVSATPSQGTYNSSSGVWTVGTVTTSTAQTLQIVAAVVSGNTQTNTATVSHADQFDPNTANNTASATETPQRADLALAKSASNATPNVGDTATFTVTLTDNGPDPATNVAAVDQLPAGLAFLSATPSQGTYNSGSGIWTVGTVTTSTSPTLVVHALVVSPSAQTNTATVSHADQFDPNTANNGATATVTPQRADLTLTKSASNATPNVGDTMTFTVTLTDNGPDAATNVMVQDLLPAGLSFVSSTPSQGFYNSGAGTWMVGTLTTSAQQTLQIQVTVVSPSAQTNTASISHADQFDPNPANNSGSATETPQQADLHLVKTVSDSTPNVGDTITFTVTLTDSGPDPATNVMVQDLLPAGLSFASSTPSQGFYLSGTGTWTVGTVTTLAPQTLQIQAIVVSPSAQTNTATISHADQFDPNTGNNSGSATETPQQADLRLTKTVSNSAPNVGDTITFTVTLSNNGPDTGTNVTVQDFLPAGLTFVSATPSQGSYNAGLGTWTVGTVTTSTPQTLQIQATVVSASAATNTASLSHADQFDPNTANNSASASETPQQADLQLANIVSNPTPILGDPITFTVTLSNNGPDTATNVTVQDLLPAGLTFVSATPGQGSYSSVSGVWTVGTVTTSTPATLLIQATVASPSPRTDTATVSGADQFDPNPANNSASATETP